jgi:hypothetical protein
MNCRISKSLVVVDIMRGNIALKKGNRKTAGRLMAKGLSAAYQMVGNAAQNSNHSSPVRKISGTT